MHLLSRSLLALVACAGCAFAADSTMTKEQMATNAKADLAEKGTGFAPDVGTFRQDWRARRDAALAKDPTLPHDPYSLLVKFNAKATPAEREALIALVGGQTIQTWPQFIPDVHHITIDVPLDRAMQMLSDVGTAMDLVDYVEPDLFYRLNATPNDSLYSLLWGMNNTGQNVGGDVGVANNDIDANLAWDLVTGSTTFAVGIADSGIRRTHADLSTNIWTNAGEIAGDRIDNDGNGRIDDTWGWDFWNNDNNPADDNGHGTHTSGTVGARGNNATGVTGVCWTIRLAGLKIGSATGSISVTSAASALDYCRGKGIRLSNHSWGGGGFSSTLNTAISSARTAGHLIIAAAGNGGADGIGDNNNTVPQYPASYSQDNIIAVAATDNDGRLASFSNFGSTSVDLAAPGVTIASTYNSSDTSYVYLNGTSMATPHVTGVAALVWIRNPTFTYLQVRSRLLSTTRANANLSGRCVTGGVVNAYNAVR